MTMTIWVCGLFSSPNRNVTSMRRFDARANPLNDPMPVLRA